MTTLEEILESVSGLGHPEYPLLDPDYSTGSLMPVVDFSPALRDLILERNWSTIHAFMVELNRNDYGRHVADALVEIFRSFKISDYLEGSPEALAEITAIFILTLRIPSSGSQSDSAYWQLTMLLENTLCCCAVSFQHSAKESLLKGLSANIAEQKREGYRMELPDPTMADFEALDDEPPQSIVCQRLAAIPVTSRMVVFDAMTRDWGHSTIRRLRPELYYGQRQFGNNTEWNMHYVAWSEIFIPPPADTDITKLLSKERIRAEADTRSISIPKSYSRSRMLERIRVESHEGYQALFAKATRDSAIVNPAKESALNEILERRRRIEYACRALAGVGQSLSFQLSGVLKRRRRIEAIADIRTYLSRAEAGQLQLVDKKEKPVKDSSKRRQTLNDKLRASLKGLSKEEVAALRLDMKDIAVVAPNHARMKTKKERREE